MLHTFHCILFYVFSSSPSPSRIEPEDFLLISTPDDAHSNILSAESSILPTANTATVCTVLCVGGGGGGGGGGVEGADLWVLPFYVLQMF